MVRRQDSNYCRLQHQRKALVSVRQDVEAYDPSNRASPCELRQLGRVQFCRYCKWGLQQRITTMSSSSHTQCSILTAFNF